MNFLPDIRQLYHPVQPTVKPTAQDVSYREILPHSKLQPFIYCYWELKTSAVLKEEFNYKVVADGCIDIFFELQNPEDNFVMGFCKKYTEFPLGNSFHYVGIRFLPTMFPQLFKVNAAELSNRYERLDQVIPATANFIRENFSNATGSADQTRRLFDNYFLELLSKVTFNDDQRLYRAIHIILKNSGVVNVEKDLDTGVSPRQLRRLFEFYVGDTTKTFSKVVRFQNILKAKPSTRSLHENRLFFDGYYDQAHFIKEFRNFYGVTPGKVFGR